MVRGGELSTSPGGKLPLPGAKDKQNDASRQRSLLPLTGHLLRLPTGSMKLLKQDVKTYLADRLIATAWFNNEAAKSSSSSGLPSIEKLLKAGLSCSTQILPADINRSSSSTARSIK
jgi:hypothetical protein